MSVDPKNFRVLFMGSSPFAIPALEVLLSLDVTLLGIVCQPDKPAGRGQKMSAPPTKAFALENEIPLFQPEKLDASFTRILTDLKPDLSIVAAYGKILPRALLAVPKLGSVNIHGSLLPKWRGAAPIQRALLEGDAVTGITLQLMDEGLDTGDILFQKQTPIREIDDTGTLHDRLAKLGAEAIAELFRKNLLVHGALPARTKQDASLVTHAPKITGDDRVLDWNAAAAVILRRVRAMSPRPGAQTWTPEGPFQILKAREAPAPGNTAHQDLSPGSVVQDGSSAYVATGKADAFVEILEIKAPGTRAMTTADFLRGRRFPLAFQGRPQ